MLDDDDGVIGQHDAVSEIVQDRRIEAGRIRRIEEDEIEWRGFGCQLFERGNNVAKVAGQ